MSLKTRLNVVRLLNPERIATSVIGISGSSRSVSAALVRLAFMYCKYDIELYRLKIREK